MLTCLLKTQQKEKELLVTWQIERSGGLVGGSLESP